MLQPLGQAPALRLATTSQSPGWICKEDRIPAPTCDLQTHNFQEPIKGLPFLVWDLQGKCLGKPDSGSSETNEFTGSAWPGSGQASPEAPQRRCKVEWVQGTQSGCMGAPGSLGHRCHPGISTAHGDRGSWFQHKGACRKNLWKYHFCL